MTKTAVRVEDHLQMLTDTVRMQAYQQAIDTTVRPGDVVIDLGAGLGILSLMAARAGARRVYAIEKEDSIDVAKRIADDNGYADTIVFLKQNSLDVVLSEQADVLVTETLGSFGLDENCLHFIRDARERLLKPDARIIPESITPWLAPVEVPGIDAIAEPWRQIAGFDFLGAIQETIETMGMILVEPSQLLGPPLSLGRIDLKNDNESNTQWQLAFQISQAGNIDALAGWFEVQLCEGVSISTAPDCPHTHWQQALFPLRESLAVREEDCLEALLLSESGGRRDEANITVDVRFSGPAV